MLDSDSSAPQKLTMSNTKKEMLAAYREVLKQLEDAREQQVKPEEKVEEKAKAEATKVADSLSMDGIGREVGTLKSEIGKMLAELSDKLEDEIERYLQVKKAVAAKQGELEEIFEIERSASSLAALMETQRRKRDEFEAEMAERKQALSQEIESTREAWAREKQEREAAIKEQRQAEQKQQQREADEFKYKIERERKLAQEEFEYEKARLEREVAVRKEELERDLGAREQNLKEREAELADLRSRAEAFPQEMEAAVAKAVADTTAALQREAEGREALMKKDAESRQEILNSRIEALQQTVKEQAEQIARLSAQLEKSYGQVQDIAVKAIEGSSDSKAFAAMQRHAQDPARRGQEEK